MSKSKVIVRQATLKDLPEIIKVEQEAWPDGTEANDEMFRSRIETFPEGVHVAELDGRLIGVVAFELLDYDIENPIPTWNEATDNGLIRKSHNPNGNTVFGIDLSAVPDAPRGIGTKLLIEVGKIAVNRNLKCGVLGGRLPNYKKYADKMTAEEYLNATNEKGEPLDPEVRFYKRTALKIGKILPDYFEDPDSLSYGVLLIWNNPFYVKNRFLKLFVPRIARMLFKIYVWKVVG